MSSLLSCTPLGAPPWRLSWIKSVQRAPGCSRTSLRHGIAGRVSAQPGRKFADFLQFEEGGSDAPVPPSPPAKVAGAEIGTDKASDIVDRAGSLLIAAREALQQVRNREPADSRLRQRGSGIQGRTTDTASSSEEDSSLGGSSSGSGGAYAASSRGLTSFVWESDLDEDESGAGGGAYGSSRDYAAPPVGAAGGFGSGGEGWDKGGGGEGGGGGGGGAQSWDQAGLDSWFGNKVDTGPLLLRKTLAPMKAADVAVLDRPEGITSLEFGAPEAPASAGPSIFPASMQLYFQPSEAEAAPAVEAETEAEAPVVAPEGNWERRSGEEMGAHGYWYRWTEVRGCDDTGAVQWYEKWWEVSDWKGTKEMGAEKWGCNERGDAWRETWREAIAFDEANNQPFVERSAHKWANNLQGNEWEEKWGEKYWSAGKAEKFAEKWAREGGDVWHEKWGENYDGEGGCLKYTDKWAERDVGLGGKDEWGDKWEETFKNGSGNKKGETWSISAGGERYNRYWGENHMGNGYVQRFGHSNTGEHWDQTEQMDTYYNPIPHFGYDLALAHSPILRGVPMLPRDNDLGGTSLEAVL